MAEPWLTIIGIGEDGLAGLSDAGQQALEQADIVFGGPRHLELADCRDRGRAWPLPFDVAPVLACRGKNVAVLASGDPFSYGVGSLLAVALKHGEWRAIPAPGIFEIACARMGWPRESTTCIGLHAAPFEKLGIHLFRECRIIATLRDGKALTLLTKWLVTRGCDAMQVTVLERLGGPRERILKMRADSCVTGPIDAPVSVALCGADLPQQVGISNGPGRDEAEFMHDGQITKSPIRAITLAALGPRQGEILWDIGAGSGSVSIEWALAGGRSYAIEARTDRLQNIRGNIFQFGLSHLIEAIHGIALDVMPDLPPPDAVFIGGGASADLFDAIWKIIPHNIRLVANAVTLETETLLIGLHERLGGTLMRIDISEAAPLGKMRGWRASRPVVQWRVTKDVSENGENP